MNETVKPVLNCEDVQNRQKHRFDPRPSLGNI